jgi:hypothetical protein
MRNSQSLEPHRLFLKSNENLSFNDKMTNYSVANHVPLIVIAYYIMKIEGPSEDFNAAVHRLVKFYKYDEIVGIKELMEL